jgi:hypothetical protein
MCWHFYAGVFLVLWVQCMDLLAKRSRQRSERFFKPLSFTAILLLLTITGHWVLDCAQAFQAFVFAQDSQDHSNCHQSCPNAATIVYSNISDPKSVANSALYVITTLVGDTFMVPLFICQLLLRCFKKLLFDFRFIAYLLCGAVIGGLLQYHRLS